MDEFYDQLQKLDLMKINSMEIIISFQQSEHVPPPSINKFLTGIDQSSKGCPFLVYLVRHLIYSGDQGIKIQICDFFKSIFEVDTPGNSLQTREILYKFVLMGFIGFLTKIEEEGLSPQKVKKVEYSVYLIL